MPPASGVYGGPSPTVHADVDYLPRRSGLIVVWNPPHILSNGRCPEWCNDGDIAAATPVKSNQSFWRTYEQMVHHAGHPVSLPTRGELLHQLLSLVHQGLHLFIRQGV